MLQKNLDQQCFGVAVQYFLYFFLPFNNSLAHHQPAWSQYIARVSVLAAKIAYFGLVEI
ncbi:MAG: hypothetical protein JNK51_04575 [Blastocatellia bacterium]|nr:hypothetical protein [Blastocatellia bacterium]